MQVRFIEYENKCIKLNAHVKKSDGIFHTYIIQSDYSNGEFQFVTDPEAETLSSIWGMPIEEFIARKFEQIAFDKLIRDNREAPHFKTVAICRFEVPSGLSETVYYRSAPASKDKSEVILGIALVSSYSAEEKGSRHYSIFLPNKGKYSKVELTRFGHIQNCGNSRFCDLMLVTAVTVNTKKGNDEN